MIYEDITPDPGLDQRMLDRGWMVGEVDDMFVITFLDGRSPIVGNTPAIEFFTNNNKERDMPGKSANHQDDAVDVATPLIDKYMDGAITFIGATARSAAEVNRCRRPWADLARSEVIARVTMDLHPESPGRPQSGRPSTTQIVWMALPEWHPLFVHGERELAIIRYTPTTTYVAKQVNGGRVEDIVLASSFDVSGFEAVVGYESCLSDAEESASELRSAVRAFSAPDYPDNFEDADVDPALGRYGTKAAWGV